MISVTFSVRSGSSGRTRVLILRHVGQQHILPPKQTHSMTANLFRNSTLVLLISCAIIAQFGYSRGEPAAPKGGEQGAAKNWTAVDAGPVLVDGAKNKAFYAFSISRTMDYIENMMRDGRWYRRRICAFQVGFMCGGRDSNCYTGRRCTSRTSWPADICFPKRGCTRQSDCRSCEVCEIIPGRSSKFTYTACLPRWY